MTAIEHRDFEQFYRASKDRCLRAFLAVAPDVQIADDLVAEAFTRALERWDEVRTHPSPRAWVVRTAMNLHIDQWRKSNRRPRLVRETAGGGDDRLDPQLVSALLELSPRQREVLALRVLLDLSNQDTAAALGIEPATVPVHLRRALAALRQTFPTKEALHDHAR